MFFKKNSGPLLIFLAAVLWALDGVLRRSLFSLPPSTIVFYEHLIGAAILIPFALPKLKKIKITKKVWGALIWVSLFSGLLGTLLFTSALSKTNFIPFSVVFLLQKLQPIFAIIAAHIVLKEKITKKFLKWAALALIAAFFVTFKNGSINLSTGQGTVMAGLMAVGAAFFWGSSTAFSRFGLKELDHTLMTALRFALTVPLAFAAMMLLGTSGSLISVQPDQLLRLLLIALSTGMVALWIYYKGLKTTEAKKSTIIELAFPLTAVFIDIFLYQTVLAPSQYAAAAVLILSMYQVVRLDRS